MHGVLYLLVCTSYRCVPVSELLVMHQQQLLASQKRDLGPLVAGVGADLQPARADLGTLGVGENGAEVVVATTLFHTHAGCQVSHAHLDLRRGTVGLSVAAAGEVVIAVVIMARPGEARRGEVSECASRGVSDDAERCRRRD